VATMTMGVGVGAGVGVGSGWLAGEGIARQPARMAMMGMA